MLTYDVGGGFGVVLGVITAQPLLTESGKVRFPWFDVVTPEENNTRFYLGVIFDPSPEEEEEES